LNYTTLGQNVLDSQSLGLMVHVHTFNDHSEAGLVGWGSREAHPQHATLFGGPNPYSCVSLSDAFGPHSKVPNEPLTKLREATITRVYWYDDPSRDAKLTTSLGPSDGAGFFFAHLETGGPVAGSGDYMDFWRSVDKHFVLRARGRDDVPAQGIQKYWIDSDRDINDFILRIEAADMARMEPGVEYELVWEGQDQPLRWKIAKGVAIEKPKR
jgi:hypothetical protein